MISPHKHDVLKHLKKHPKGSQNAPNGTIFFKNFPGEAPRTPQREGTPLLHSSPRRLCCLGHAALPRSSACLTVSHFYFNPLHIFTQQHFMYYVSNRRQGTMTPYNKYIVYCHCHGPCYLLRYWYQEPTREVHVNIVVFIQVHLC